MLELMQRLICEDYIWQHTPQTRFKTEECVAFLPHPRNTSSPVPGHRDLLGNGSGLVVCRCDPGRCCVLPSAVLPSTALGATKLPEPGSGHPSSKGFYLCYRSNLGPARREQAQTCPLTAPLLYFIACDSLTESTWDSPGGRKDAFGDGCFAQRHLHKKGIPDLEE